MENSPCHGLGGRTDILPRDQAGMNRFRETHFAGPSGNDTWRGVANLTDVRDLGHGGRIPASPILRSLLLAESASARYLFSREGTVFLGPPPEWRKPGPG